MFYIYYEYSVRYPNTEHLLGSVRFGFDMYDFDFEIDIGIDMKDKDLLTHLY
jgi:hypothetical protein